MTRSFLFIFLCFLKFSADAAEPDTVADPHLIVKIPVTSCLDLFGGLAYRAAAEFRLSEDFAVSLEVGKYYSYPGSLSSIKGGLGKLELKYYLEGDAPWGDYISAEYMYKNTTFNFTDSFAIPHKPRFEKEYTIHKEISCLTFKYGNLSVYKKRWIVEWYFGLGLRYYSKAYNNLSDDENEYMLTGEGHGDLVADGIRFTGPPKVLPNLVAGVKLGILVF
jgi:hypothetical protein